jgi:hypothetical protein
MTKENDDRNISALFGDQLSDMSSDSVLFKDKPVNAVEEYKHCLLRELYKIIVYNELPPWKAFLLESALRWSPLFKQFKVQLPFSQKLSRVK